MSQRKRHDGSVIDPEKNLEEYVQSFDRTAAPEPPEPPPVAAATAEPAPPPEPTAPETPAAPPPPDPLVVERARAEFLQKQLETQQAELAQLRQQRQIDEAARRAVAEQQQPKTQIIQQPPQEDPRWKQVDNLWFEKPIEARALMRKIQDDEYDKRLAADREKTKQEVFGELTTKQRKEQGNNAYNTAMQRLRDAGVGEADINPNRITAVYTVITRPPSQTAPNPYYSNGGPLNPDVIVAAWQDLFGAPNARSQTPAPAPTITTAPPGSSRPAPAAVPQRTAAQLNPIDPNLKKDYEHMADVYGYKTEDLLARRRARMEREGR